MTDATRDELLKINQRLLDSIAAADWKTYESLCDASLSCFEPEAAGQLVEGMPFHHFYFELGGAKSPHNTTMISPHVRALGQDAAVVSYVRLNQRVDGDRNPKTSAVCETRVWQRKNSQWKHVHFHRSPA